MKPLPTMFNSFAPHGLSAGAGTCGTSLAIFEWSGGGPPWMHIHHSDDEAWYVLEGALTFQFVDRQMVAPAGTTVFVPAGVAHTYFVSEEPGRYLIIMTPRLNELVNALHAASPGQHQEVMAAFDSEICD